MEKARQFLLDISELGLPTGTEALTRSLRNTTAI